MSTSEIRERIELTRSSLSDTVDSLADQANPAHLAQRQVSKVKGRLRRLVDRIVGSAHDAADSTTGAAHELAGRGSEVGDLVADAPRAVRRQTEGSPLTAGAVAFGLGLLVAAAFPASSKERELARAAKEQAQPLTDRLAAAGQEVADNLAEPAREAAEALKDSATQAVQHVQDEGKDAVAEVQDAARDSAGDVQQAARDSAGNVRDTARDAAGDIQDTARS